MSASFEVNSSTGAYKVEITPGLYDRQLTQTDKTDLAVICDERFADAYKSAGFPVIALKADESVKSLNNVPDIIIALRKQGANRKTRLLAVGGGIVQDVAAFCAAIYMRGLSWDYMPTTLLGMVDSCIGGKSSINVGEYKNIVGTFNPPARVLIDPKLSATLSASQMVAGLTESAKICYCRGGDAWQNYMALTPSVHMRGEAASALIATSLTAKKWFIETDEFDRNERLLLNLGHTFGHAFEGASHFAIAHGIAVGLGILCAMALGRRLGTKYVTGNRALELEAHIRELLAQMPELPGLVQDLSIGDCLDRFRSDKKHSSTHYTVVMMREDGDAVLVRLPKDKANEDAISGAIGDGISEIAAAKSAA